MHAVHPLPEGIFTVDQSKTFVPFDEATDQLKDRPASLLVAIVPFVIKTAADLVVIDPGLGTQTATGDFIIQQNLQALGYEADEVSLVLLSHLHKDHAGGICYGSGSAFNLMFPNATYCCQQKELEFAFSKKGSPSYEQDKLEFLCRHPALHLLSGDGELTDGIKYEISGGHTPCHQVFHFQSAGKEFFYGGDVVPQSSQLIRRFVAKYDFDGKRSAQLRLEYAARGAEEHWTFLLFHDAKKPMAQVRNKDNRYVVE